MVTWNSEADVVVIGAGATGSPRPSRRAKRAHRSSWSRPSRISAAMPWSAAATFRSAAAPARRRRTGSRIRLTCVFADLTDWSVVQPNGFPDYRYNDREIVRAFADNNVSTYDWLLAITASPSPTRRPMSAAAFRLATRCRAKCTACRSTGRVAHTGKPVDRRNPQDLLHRRRPDASADRRGAGCGVEILLEHKMTALHRENGDVGPRRRHRGRASRHDALASGRARR